jgi:hypothetical protein
MPLPDAGPRDAGPPDTGPLPDVVCPAGTAECDGTLSEVCETTIENDPSNCGRCGNVCPAPRDSIPICATGACAGFRCLVGFTDVAGACVRTPPRLIAPISTSWVTDRRPTLRWRLAVGQNGTDIEVCTNRACSVGSSLARFTVAGGMESAEPPAALPPGVVWWRARGMIDGVAVTGPSRTWQMTIPPRDAPVDTAHGSSMDVNGDGFADIAMSGIANDIYIFHGGATGVPAMPNQTLTRPGEWFGLFISAAGDVNGDGYGDFAAGSHYGMAVYFGGPTGLPATASQAFGIGGNANHPAALGDVDGDGYADLGVMAWSDGTGGGAVMVLRGSPTGVSVTPLGTDFPMGGTRNRDIDGGDVNGDGLADVLAVHDDMSALYLGRPGGITRTPILLTHATMTAGQRAGSMVRDGDGDGRADIVIGQPGRASTWYFAGTATGVAPAVAFTSPEGGDWLREVSNLGDIDGDGLGDVGVTSVSFTGRPSDQSIFLGHAGTGNTVIDFEIGNPYGDGWGLIHGAGDVNGDGFDEMIAAQGRDVGLYLGTSGGFMPVRTITVTGAMVGQRGVAWLWMVTHRPRYRRG